jgi:hypothetical protein
VRFFFAPDCADYVCVYVCMYNRVVIRGHGVCVCVCIYIYIYIYIYEHEYINGIVWAGSEDSCVPYVHIVYVCMYVCIYI